MDKTKQCSMCGTAAWEWERDKFAYEAATYTCRGCMILDAAKEGFEPGPGMRMVLVPKKRAEKIRG